MSDSIQLSSPLRRRRASDDNMIPLINIVFLLLIFFMVASQIDAFRPADVVLPEIDAGEKATVEDLTIVVTASGDIFVDEQHMDRQQLGTRLASQGATRPDRKITVQADKQVTSAALSPVLSALRQHQISDIRLYVQRKVSEDL